MDTFKLVFSQKCKVCIVSSISRMRWFCEALCLFQALPKSHGSALPFTCSLREPCGHTGHHHSMWREIGERLIFISSKHVSMMLWVKSYPWLCLGFCAGILSDLSVLDSSNPAKGNCWDLWQVLSWLCVSLWKTGIKSGKRVTSLHPTLVPMGSNDIMY